MTVTEKPTLKLNDFYDLFNNFEKLIFNNIKNFNKKENDCFRHLVNNILCDFAATYLLLEKSYLIQAQKLTRHTFEAMVLLVYLDKCGKEYSKEDYLIDSEICDLKNSFIIYKQDKNQEKKYFNWLFLFNDELNSLNEHTKNRLRAHIKKYKKNNCLLQLPELSEENFDDYDNFFAHFRPKFMRIENMWIGIKKLDILNNKNLELIELLKYGYNCYSQTAHNKLSLQIEHTEYKENELRVFYNFLKGIMQITCDILIGNNVLTDYEYLKYII